MARTRGVEGGGKVEGLPVHTFPTDDGDVAMKCPTEIAITDRREFELSNLGFLPLLHCKGSDFAVFIGRAVVPEAEDLLRRGRQRQRRAVGEVQPASCARRGSPLPEGDGARQDRLVHGGGRVRRAGSTTGSATTWSQLRRWSAMRPRPGSRCPDAQVDVRPVKGKPGYYEAVAYLRPHFQLEALTTSMRLVAEVQKP